MEVKHCRAQHVVLVTFVRDTFHLWGRRDQFPSSHRIDCAASELADNRFSPIPVTSELESLLTRARVLSEECCRPLPPLQAALLHAKRSQTFTDIVREIQWCVAVVLHGRRTRMSEEHCPKLKEFPWDAKVGDQEQVKLDEAEQEDWRTLMVVLKGWERDHECSSEQCGNVYGRRDPRFCLATQFIKKVFYQEQVRLRRSEKEDLQNLLVALEGLERDHSSSEQSGNVDGRRDPRVCLAQKSIKQVDESDHLSLLWSFDDSIVIPGHMLGVGSFAAVTKATWMGNTYAKKTFGSVGLTSLRGEMEALVKLNHPHIVKMYAYSEDSLLLDLMSSDLHKFMRKRMQGRARKEPFSLPAAIDLMLQIADAVSYAHSQGMVHRDLKSSNILVDDLEDGYVFAKVADFGLAKVKHEMTLYSHCTLNVGTRRWMAPEVFKANKEDEHLQHAYPMKADVYSFGIVCSEILSGEVPYSDLSLNELGSLYSKLTSSFPLRPRLPSSCPRALVSLICSCWDTDPRERPEIADVCRVLRYLKGIRVLGGVSRTSNRNSIDEKWPFGRLPTLEKDQQLQDCYSSQHELYDVSGIECHFGYVKKHLVGLTMVSSREGKVVRVGGYSYSTTSIMFDYPSEYLVQVEASCSSWALNSISFITTKQKYGPYGETQATDSQFSSPLGRVVGFKYEVGSRRQSHNTLLFEVYVLQDIVRCTRHFIS